MTSYSSSKEEIEVASTVQPFKEEPRASNKDFDKDLQRDEHVFSPVVLRSRLERKRFSPRSHRAVLLRVAPFLRHCKGRGYRLRAGQMENE